MKKLQGTRGFTLVETIVTLLILVLLTGTIAVGTSAATGIYGDSLFLSESDLLAGAVSTALGDVLRHSDCDDASQSPVTFTNPGYGISKGSLISENGRIYIRPNSNPGAENIVLVSEGTYTSMKIDVFQMKYQDGLFSGSYTIRGKKAAHEKEITFAFRPLNGK